MRLSATALAVSAAALLAAAARAETEVTLNGVRIDGVTNQRIDNATVFIDAQGNIHIEAKGYLVRQIGGSGQAGAGDGRTGGAEAKLERRYFLVAEQPERDGAGYDVAVFINQKWVRDIKAGEAQVALEVTKHLRPGSNKVVLASTRNGASRRGGRDAVLRVVLGEGTAAGDHVAIESPLVEMTRNAAENESFTEEYQLVAR